MLTSYNKDHGLSLLIVYVVTPVSGRGFLPGFKLLYYNLAARKDSVHLAVGIGKTFLADILAERTDYMTAVADIGRLRFA